MTLPAQVSREIERDAASIVKQMIGTGYVDEFYLNEAGPIVGLVEHWIDRTQNPNGRKPGDPILPTPPTFTVVSTRFWNASQSWNGEQIVRVLDKTLRATVHRDGYDPQSYGRVDMLTETGWTRVLDRSIKEIPACRVSYVDKPAEPFHQSRLLDGEDIVWAEMLIGDSLEQMLDAAVVILNA